jgi:hypothetical protein
MYNLLMIKYSLNLNNAINLMMMEIQKSNLDGIDLLLMSKHIKIKFGIHTFINFWDL